MAKQIVTGVDSRQTIPRGVNTLADAVKIMLGSKGRNAVIEKKFGAAIITKDGVTVAKEIELQDPLENMGERLRGNGEDMTAQQQYHNLDPKERRNLLTKIGETREETRVLSQRAYDALGAWVKTGLKRFGKHPEA